MENASKALLMAGTILISLLVIGALVFVYRDITSAKRADEEALKTQQLEEFNKQFTSYERNLTGSELLSLVNKMADYNKGQAEKKGYSKMNIEFKFTSRDLIYNKFLNKGVQYSLDLNSKTKEGWELTAVSKEIDDIVKKYNGDSNLQKYASKLSDNVDNNGNWTTNGKSKFKNDIEAVGLDSSVADDPNKINEIKTYAAYIEFKRKTFVHKGTKYDENNGRVVKMTFEGK